MSQLTEKEMDALILLFNESENTDHDFGVLEDIQYENRQVLGGLLTSLQGKGFVTKVYPNQIVNGESLTQYTLNVDSCKNILGL